MSPAAIRVGAHTAACCSGPQLRLQLLPAHLPACVQVVAALRTALLPDAKAADCGRFASVFDCVLWALETAKCLPYCGERYPRLLGQLKVCSYC